MILAMLRASRRAKPGEGLDLGLGLWEEQE